MSYLKSLYDKNPEKFQIGSTRAILKTGFSNTTRETCHDIGSRVWVEKISDNLYLRRKEEVFLVGSEKFGHTKTVETLEYFPKEILQKMDSWQKK